MRDAFNKTFSYHVLCIDGGIDLVNGFLVYFVTELIGVHTQKILLHSE